MRHLHFVALLSMLTGNALAGQTGKQQLQTAVNNCQGAGLGHEGNIRRPFASYWEAGTVVCIYSCALSADNLGSGTIQVGARFTNRGAQLAVVNCTLVDNPVEVIDGQSSPVPTYFTKSMPLAADENKIMLWNEVTGYSNNVNLSCAPSARDRDELQLPVLFRDCVVSFVRLGRWAGLVLPTQRFHGGSIHSTPCSSTFAGAVAF